MNRYIFDQIRVGDSFSFEENISEEKMQLFLLLSGDNNPLHTSDKYAKRHNMQGRVVYGMLTSTFYSKLVGVYLPGENCLLQEIAIQFNNPLYVNDNVIVEGIVSSKDETFHRLEINAKIKSGTKLISRAKIKVGVRQ